MSTTASSAHFDDSLLPKDASPLYDRVKLPSRRPPASPSAPQAERGAPATPRSEAPAARDGDSSASSPGKVSSRDGRN